MTLIATPDLVMSAMGLAQPICGRPALPAANVTWPFPLLMFVAVLFVTAACIGWYVRFELPGKAPPAPGHHERAAD